MDWCLALRKQPGACPVSVRFPRGSKAASTERREAWLDALKIVGDEVRDVLPPCGSASLLTLWMHSQRELISSTAAANYAEHYVWLPHFREEDREQGRQKNERLVKRKRERPSGYAAEGFLCGPGDKPSQAKKKARAEEWVRPDASPRFGA